MKHIHSSKATFIGCFAVLFWGMTLPLTKFLGGYLGQFTSGSVAFLVGGVLAVITLGLPVQIENWRLFSLRLVLYVGYMVLLYIALTGTSPEALPYIILTNYLWPLATVLFSLWLLKIRPDKKRLFTGMALAVTGVFIELGGTHLLSLPTPPWWCTLLTMIGAIGWGFHSALNRVVGDQWGGVKAISILMIVTGIISLIIALLRGEPMNFVEVPKAPLFIYALLPFLGNICWDLGTRKGNIVILGFVADLTPWFSLLGAALLLQSPLHPSIIIAACFILLGAWICRSVGVAATN